MSAEFLQQAPGPVASQASARPPILVVRPDGLCAELVVDTGMRLSTGRTWRAFAKVRCKDVYTASLVAEQLNKRLGDAVEQARREAYEAGYRDARQRRNRRRQFSRTL